MHEALANVLTFLMYVFCYLEELFLAAYQIILNEHTMYIFF